MPGFITIAIRAAGHTTLVDEIIHYLTQKGYKVHYIDIDYSTPASLFTTLESTSSDIIVLSHQKYYKSMVDILNNWLGRR